MEEEILRKRKLFYSFTSLSFSWGLIQSRCSVHTPAPTMTIPSSLLIQTKKVLDRSQTGPEVGCLPMWIEPGSGSLMHSCGLACDHFYCSYPQSS